jgi:hypothetical protein
MLLNIPDVLDARQLAEFRARLDSADWADGRITAGHQSVLVARGDGTVIVAGQSHDNASLFTGDVLARLGVRNAFAAHPERYPKVPLEELHAVRPDLVVLPDEPYLFTVDDGPEAFAGIPAALVSGRALTWYGPSLGQAPTVLTAQLDQASIR